MRDYDIYLFDWDGTIAESTAIWLRAIRRQFDKLGLHPADDEIIRRMGDGVPMLGDADRDILAAHGAGVDSLLYYPPAHERFHNIEELRGHRPTYIIHDWKEMLQ